MFQILDLLLHIPAIALDFLPGIKQTKISSEVSYQQPVTTEVHSEVDLRLDNVLNLAADRNINASPSFQRENYWMPNGTENYPLAPGLIEPGPVANDPAYQYWLPNGLMLYFLFNLS